MTQNKVNFFVTGATGYVGGSVLAHFLKHPERNEFEFTALVRSVDKAERLRQQFGVNAILGSFSDSDVVLSLADADDLGSIQAILKGLKRKYEVTGIPPSPHPYCVLADNAVGMHGTDEVYSDLDVEKFEKLPLDQPHRGVDLEVLEADKQGKAKPLAYIIAIKRTWSTPLPYMESLNHALTKAGIANPHSIQIPAIVQASLDRGRAGMVGKGKNIWHNVDIDEISELYTTLYDAITSNPAAAHGREGIYIGENGQHTLYDVAKAVQEAMIKMGLSKETEPNSFTREEVEKYFGGDYLGVNSHCRSERTRAIGWKPTKTTEDFLASIRPEVEALRSKGPGITPLK
ncbi:NAD(P)-binding protein [Amanita rubescens]|nr:NAD(P)-binding protein [Amanita rubescens]